MRPLLLLLLTAAPVLAQPTLLPGTPAPEAAFGEAYALYNAGLYAEAARAFADYRARVPEGARTAEALYYQAEAALGSGEDELAAALFARFRQQHPDHPLAPRARLALGEFYVGTGEYARAIDALGEAVAEGQPDPDAARALLLMGEAALRSGQPDAAVGYYRRAAYDYPAEDAAPRALYAAGFAEVGRDDYAAAVPFFERLTTRYRRSQQAADLGLGLAEAYGRLGEYEKAVVELEGRLPQTDGVQRQRAQFLLAEANVRLGRVRAAEPFLREIPETGPYGRRARFTLSRLAFDRGEWETAATGLEQVATWPGEAYDDLAAEADYYRGLALKKVRRLNDADEALARVAERRAASPYADAALLERGLLLYERRSWDRAATTFQQLLERYPQSAVAGEAARMLGETYAALGDYARAERAYRQAEQLGTVPTDLKSEVRFQQAFQRYEAGAFAPAAQDLFAVYEEDRRGTRAGEALFWAAEANFQAGQRGDAGAFARALGQFQLFLERFPEHRQADAARYALAWTHFKRRDYGEAAAAFERFLAAYRPTAEIVPYAADARLRLGDAYYGLKRWDAAAAAYGRVRGPGQDYATFQTGQALEGAGRNAEAAAAYERLLADYPQSPVRPAALYARGALRFQAGDYDGATALYRQVIAEYPGSPIAAKAQYGIGDALFNAGDAAAAEAAYRVVLDRYPQSVLVGDALSGLQFALAAQGAEGRIDDVIAEFARRNPDVGAVDELRYRSAEGKYQSGDLEGALRDFQALLTGSRDAALRPGTLFYLGRITAELDRSSEAEGYLRRLLGEHGASPLVPEAAAFLGGLYLQERRWADALAVYQELGSDAATPEAGAEARFGQARAYLGMGRPADAESLLRALLDEYPDAAASAAARLALAEALEAQGRLADAEQAYRAAARGTTAEAAEATARLGRLLLERRRPEEALALVDGAEERFAGFPAHAAAALLVRARALRALDRPVPADEAYQTLLSSFPETDAALQARQDLGR